MTLLISTIAAIACTVIWYSSEKARKLQVGTLTLMYWGASLMWFVDAFVEYLDVKEEYFNPAAKDMLNDTFLGLSVVALGLVIWIVILLVKDPTGVVRAALNRKQDNGKR
ncbi:MAG: hypothetical protein IKP95_12615 [Ruminococcus sp.]|nr:hypothetical protein [Ruminococcus sp.]